MEKNTEKNTFNWIQRIVATYRIYFDPVIVVKTSQIVDRGVSNALNWRPAGSVVFQDRPHDLIYVAPGFVIDHFYTLMWCCQREWSNKDWITFV